MRRLPITGLKQHFSLQGTITRNLKRSTRVRTPLYYQSAPAGYSKGTIQTRGILARRQKRASKHLRFFIGKLATVATSSYRMVEQEASLDNGSVRGQRNFPRSGKGALNRDPKIKRIAINVVRAKFTRVEEDCKTCKRDGFTESTELSSVAVD